MGRVNLRIKGPPCPYFYVCSVKWKFAVFSYRRNTGVRLSVFVWSAIAFFCRSASKCKQGIQPHLNVHTWAQIYSICFKACQGSSAGLLPTPKLNPSLIVSGIFRLPAISGFAAHASLAVASVLELQRKRGHLVVNAFKSLS